MAGDIGVQGSDDIGNNGASLQILDAAEHFCGNADPCFQSLCLLEIRFHSIGQRGLLDLINNGIGLFGRQLEMTILLELRPRRFPPFLPV